MFLNHKLAEANRCAALSGDPKKGWCWLAALNEPFDLQCAQRLLLDIDGQKYLRSFHLKNLDGQTIPSYQLAGKLRRTHCKEG